MPHHKMKKRARLPPKGCAAVRVGEERRRFVVPVAYLSHPLFAELLEEAAAEYGYNQEGELAIPCVVEHFCQVQDAIDREIGGAGGHHQHLLHHLLPHFAGCFGI